MSRPWLKPAFIGAVALLSTLVVSCSNGNDVGVPEEVVIDASATEDNPVRLKLTELAEFDVYYYTHEETNILDNKLVYPGGLQPNVNWELVVDDEVTAAEGTNLTFRAKVELFHNGKPIDSYYFHRSSDVLKNEIVAEREFGPDAYGWGASPYKAPYQLSNESGEPNTLVMASDTGTDFVFRFSEIEIGTEPFTPTEIVKPSPPPPPTFEDTPEDQFNQLVYENRWALPPTATTEYTYPNGRTVPKERVPAFAVKSLFDQINERRDSTVSSWSPAQLMEDWTTRWNKDLITAGVDLLGDDAIKETWQQVQQGNIERWFSSGTWVVGYGENEIPPGTYQTTAAPGELIKDGYWERTSTSGDIIDNDFVTSAQQVTVTITPTDGQFESSRMGVWKPVG